MSQVLRAREIGMLAGRMSTRAVNRELNFHFLPVSRLQRRFRELGSASNQPHNHRPRATTPAQDLHIRPVHLHNRLRPTTRTAAAVIGLQNHRISAQTVRNHFWGVCLHAQQPHRALWNWQQMGTAHILWRLARWRGVFLTDESQFPLFRTDGRQCLYFCSIEESSPLQWLLHLFAVANAKRQSQSSCVHCDPRRFSKETGL